MDSKPWSSSSFWEEKFNQGTTPWDLGEPSPSLVHFENDLSVKKGGSVLVPGCGYGHDALFLARKGYKVSAVDWSKAAIEEVRQFARRESLSIETLCTSFWDIPKSWHSSFDWWFEHTFFCAIDPSERPRYIESLHKLLRPQGKFVGVLFISKEPPNVGPPFLTTEYEIRTLFSPGFIIENLHPSPFNHPKREPIEWWAEFTKKS